MTKRVKSARSSKIEKTGGMIKKSTANVERIVARIAGPLPQSQAVMTIAAK